MAEASNVKTGNAPILSRIAEHGGAFWALKNLWLQQSFHRASVHNGLKADKATSLLGRRYQGRRNCPMAIAWTLQDLSSVTNCRLLQVKSNVTNIYSTGSAFGNRKGCNPRLIQLAVFGYKGGA